MGDLTPAYLTPGSFIWLLEYCSSVELARAGEFLSFGSPAGYPEDETPVLVCCQLPPSGLVVLVPHPASKAAAANATATIVFRSIFTIINVQSLQQFEMLQ